MAKEERHEETQFLLLTGNGEISKSFLQTVGKGNNPEKPEVIEVYKTPCRDENERRCFVELQSVEKDSSKLFDKRNPKMRSVSIRPIITEDTCITLQGPYWESLGGIVSTILEEDPLLEDRGIYFFEQTELKCFFIKGPFALVGHLRVMIFAVLRLLVEFGGTQKSIRDLVKLALDEDDGGDEDEGEVCALQLLELKSGIQAPFPL